MSVQREFYEQRALSARSDAESAVLANVRERHLCAALAWEGMAARAGRTERMRVEVETRKRSEREAAEADAAIAG
jgi:hypothetical protein